MFLSVILYSLISPRVRTRRPSLAGRCPFSPRCADDMLPLPGAPYRLPYGLYNLRRLLCSLEHKQHVVMVFEAMQMNLRETLKKFGRKVRNSSPEGNVEDGGGGVGCTRYHARSWVGCVWRGRVLISCTVRGGVKRAKVFYTRDTGLCGLELSGLACMMFYGNKVRKEPLPRG